MGCIIAAMKEFRSLKKQIEETRIQVEKEKVTEHTHIEEHRLIALEKEKREQEEAKLRTERLAAINKEWERAKENISEILHKLNEEVFSNNKSIGNWQVREIIHPHYRTKRYWEEDRYEGGWETETLYFQTKYTQEMVEIDIPSMGSVIILSPITSYAMSENEWYEHKREIDLDNPSKPLYIFYRTTSIPQTEFPCPECAPMKEGHKAENEWRVETSSIPLKGFSRDLLQEFEDKLEKVVVAIHKDHFQKTL